MAKKYVLDGKVAQWLVKTKYQHCLLIPRECSQGLSPFSGILGPQSLQGMVIILMGQRGKTHQLLLSALEYLKGAYKEAEEGPLARAYRDRTSAKGFKLKQERFI